ncbi:MAG: gamma-glutamyl-gamma-aminobutyrate hydrolase family protein, partial [Oscillospiraceae bacterium]|nr:gamma-glutamyl-gamma-aminobutyrate hydrolase family protein [Oscillospiraceae bacterium]
NVCGLKAANSVEFEPNAPHRVIDIMPSQIGMEHSGGTMRLGTQPCKIKDGTLLGKVYQSSEVNERHRHRFELNNDYRELLTKNGLVICGTSPDGNLAEAVELPAHNFFVGVQFHPEFKSRPDKPHPLFTELIKNAISFKKSARTKTQKGQG